MKKFLVALLITGSLLCSTSFAYTEKTLLGSHGETYVTVNPNYYKVEFMEYDTIKVTCANTGKSHTFILCKDVYYIEKTYCFDKSIVDKLSQKPTTSMAKVIVVS